MRPNRRAIALGALAWSAAPMASAADASRSDLDRFVRMRCNTVGRWGVWVYRGVLIGKVEGEAARKLLGIEGMSFNRAVAREDGGYDYTLDEAGYYCDLATGRPVDTAVNPLNGRTIAVQHYRSPQANVFRPGRVEPTATLPPGTSFEGTITGPDVIGDRIFMGEDLFVRLPARPAEGDRPARPPQVSTSMFMVSAALRDVDRRHARFVPAEATYGTMNTFRPWLEMGETPGVQNMRLEMVKFQSPAFAPAWLRERIAADHPDFFTKDGRPA